MLDLHRIRPPNTGYDYRDRLRIADFDSARHCAMIVGAHQLFEGDCWRRAGPRRLCGTCGRRWIGKGRQQDSASNKIADELDYSARHRHRPHRRSAMAFHVLKRGLSNLHALETAFAFPVRHRCIVFAMLGAEEVRVVFEHCFP